MVTERDERAVRDLLRSRLDRGDGAEGCLRALGALRDTPAHSVADLRRRDGAVGRAFEAFSRLYLTHARGWRVWYWRDLPPDVRADLGLGGTSLRRDMGIDLVARRPDGAYVAVQCKYRSRASPLGWAQVATFRALAAGIPALGAQHLVLTTASSVRWARRPAAATAVCGSTLRSIPTRVLRAMVDDRDEEQDEGRRVVGAPAQHLRPSLAELREARLRALLGTRYAA